MMNMLKVHRFDGTTNYVGPFRYRKDAVKYGMILLELHPKLICTFENDFIEDPAEFADFLTDYLTHKKVV